MTAEKEKSHDWTVIRMFDDLEFRRFLFHCALPIFAAVLTKQLAEIFSSLFGKGNLWTFGTLCIGFSVTLGLALKLYWSVTKAPTLSDHKNEGEEKSPIECAFVLDNLYHSLLDILGETFVTDSMEEKK